MDKRIAVVAIIAAGLLDFLANYLAAHYLIAVWTFLIPGGTFVFAFSFVIYDFLRRWYGFGAAVAAGTLGLVASLLWSVSFGGGVGRIAIAGIIALACSSSTDFLVQTVTIRRPVWQYVLTCNAISLLIDSIVFAEIAFAVLPPSVRFHIVEGQYLAKIAVTVVAIPLVYWARQATPQPEIAYA